MKSPQKTLFTSRFAKMYIYNIEETAKDIKYEHSEDVG